MRLSPLPGFHNYLIFYRETEETVEILRVVHGARDYERIMEMQPSGPKKHV